ADDLIVIRARMPTGIIERELGCAHRVEDEIVDLALLFRLHPLVGIEGAVGAVAARNLAGDLARDVGDLESVDGLDAAFGREQPPPRRLDAATERRHHAKSSDDDASHDRRSRRRPLRPTPQPSLPLRRTAAPYSARIRAPAVCVRLFRPRLIGTTDGQRPVSPWRSSQGT